jgi:glycine cleavage system H lipoate-binding protein/ABC-type phosphate transport system substrate-binding protein
MIAMKNTLYLFIGLLLIHFCNFSYCSNVNTEKGVTGNNISSAGSITIQSSPDLYNLTSKWASEYEKFNPGINVNVLKNTGNDNDKIQSAKGNLFFISNESFPLTENDAVWKMVIGRDAIVPVINSKNPLLKAINEQGISSDDLARLFKNGDNLQWGSLLENVERLPLHYFMTNDASVNSSLAAFLNQDQIAETGIILNDGKEMITSIQKDPYGLGFCRMKDLLDMNGQNIPENICILPIDKNRNGRIDHFENIYRDQNAFMRGVWIGKYPATLCRNIYSVSSAKPEDKTEIAFLKWILTDGQQYLNQNGYVDLTSNERDAKVGLLTETKIYANASTASHPFKTVIFILIALFVTGFIVVVTYRYINRKKRFISDGSFTKPTVFNEKSIVVPKGLYFDKSHTWAFMEIDGNVRIGIDDFLQHITGPVTRIKMKDSGEKIKKGEKIFSLIQNGKQLSIHSPVSGTIKAQNEILATNTSPINASPYTDGWVYIIEPTNWIRETQFMFMAERYSEWLKFEFSRLKDFFAASLKANTLEYAHVILQDGGDIIDNILSDFGPDVWEDFQTKFIDSSN